MKKVAVSIIMGSDSDLEIMKDAAIIMEEFGISHEITIVSAHRSPKIAYTYAQDVVKRGIQVIIAGAGGAAHLPGVIAALTHIPVIGVPMYTKTLSGIDSLYSIVQMPPGIPVATVGIGSAKNAGLLAVRMLSLSSKPLQQKLEHYIKNMEKTVVEKAKTLQKAGYKKFLEKK